MRAFTAGVACGVALALAGCAGAQQASKLRRLSHAQRAAMLASLNAALAANQEAVYAYAYANGRLYGRAELASSRFVAQELTHTGALRRLIVLAGGLPVRRQLSYPLADPAGISGVIAQLVRVEQAQIAAYARAIGLMPAPWARAVLASLLANAAQHVTVLRSLQGLPALDGAFVWPPSPRGGSEKDGVQRAQLRGLLDGQLLMVAVAQRALRSGHLRSGGSRLVSAVLEQERAHAAALARALGIAVPPPPPGPVVSAALAGVGADGKLSDYRRQIAWIDLLQLLQGRVEGAVFYRALPQLPAAASALPISIFANDAQHSTLLAQIEDSHFYADVPTAMVRGSRP